MQKAQKFWNVKKNASEKTVDIYIYGIIGEDWWNPDNGTVASQFVPEFKALEKEFDRINVRINSPGGSIWEGLPVFNVIAQSEKDVHTYCDGIAYSMGAIILLAGKQVHAAKNSLILLHAPMTIGIGNAKDMRDTADHLDKYGDSLLTSIATKTGLSADEAKSAYFDYADHLMTAQQALDSKLIDDIVDEDAKVPEGISNMSFKEVMNLYQDKKDPSSKGFINDLLAHLKTAFNISPKKLTVTDSIMENLEKFQTALNLEASASVEEILAAVSQMVADLKISNDALVSLKAEKDQLVSDLTQEQSAHVLTAKAFEDFKALDGGVPAGVAKPKDKIPGDGVDQSQFAHNVIADKI